MEGGSRGVGDLTVRSLEGLDEALLIADDRGIIRYVNAAFGHMFGAAGEAVVGAGRTGTLEPFSRHFRDPGLFVKSLLWLYDHPFEEERATWETADGRGIVRWYSRPVRDPEGRVIGRLESYREVDSAEVGLCAVERESLDALQAGIILVDDRLQVLWHNRAGGELIADAFGFDPREMRGLDALGHDAPLVRAVIEALGSGREAQLFGLEAGGRHFDVVVSPLTSGGHVHGAVLALVDASPQHEAMARCDRQRRDSEFYVDLMSHDIRNFNQVSMGYIEMLQIQDNLTEDERAYLEKALNGVLGSNKLIDDIKRVRMIRESGGKDIVPVDLDQAIGEDVQQVLKAHEGQPVVVNVSPGGGRTVLANGLLHDVFRHILGNALRYDEHPEKVVDVDVVASPEGEYLTVRIADRGPGIPDARKGTVFERMSGGSTRGAGLGLSIVRLILDRLGGRIWVEDRVPGDRSQGSVFVVQLRKA